MSDCGCDLVLRCLIVSGLTWSHDHIDAESHLQITCLSDCCADWPARLHQPGGNGSRCPPEKVGDDVAFLPAAQQAVGSIWTVT